MKQGQKVTLTTIFHEVEGRISANSPILSCDITQAEANRTTRSVRLTMQAEEICSLQNIQDAEQILKEAYGFSDAILYVT